MTQKPKFHVLSPDGLPIRQRPFSSDKAAEDFIRKWCERYELQGYYSTAVGERIPVKDLPTRLTRQVK